MPPFKDQSPPWCIVLVVLGMTKVSAALSQIEGMGEFRDVTYPLLKQAGLRDESENHSKNQE
jgi:hypothetical protein